MVQINGLDITVKECDVAQQFADRADDIGDVEVARRDFMQHRSEQEKVIAVDEGDVQVGSPRQRMLEFEGGIHPAEPTPQNQDAWFSVRHSFSRNKLKYCQVYWPALNELLGLIYCIKSVPDNVVSL